MDGFPSAVCALVVLVVHARSASSRAGGTTAYDQEAGLVSLQAIMAYWSSTTDDYAIRVANLLSGNGVSLLDHTVVTSNGGGNTLMGNHGGASEMNVFYGKDPTQETTDYNPAIGEQFINC